MTAPEFSRPFDVRELDGRATLTLSAEPHEAAAIAERLGVRSLKCLEARVELSARGDRMQLQAHWSASIVQECVVTLGPVAREYEGSDDVEFAAKTRIVREDGEVDLEAPEPLEGDVIDLGEEIVQSLALAIDPFPRCDEAASLDDTKALAEDDENIETRRPFAGLADLMAKKNENR